MNDVPKWRFDQCRRIREDRGRFEIWPLGAVAAAEDCWHTGTVLRRLSPHEL